jgi:hypothetical protein
MKKRYGQQKANNSPPEPSGLSRRKVHSRADEFVAVIFQGQSSRAAASTSRPSKQRRTILIVDFGWRSGAGQTGEDQELATPPTHRTV